MATRKKPETRPSGDPASPNDVGPLPLSINEEALIRMCFFGDADKLTQLFLAFRPKVAELGRPSSSKELEVPEISTGTAPSVLTISSWVQSISDKKGSDYALLYACYNLVGSRLPSSVTKSIILEED